MAKAALLKECKKILQTPKVDKWYSSHLYGKSQRKTLHYLEKGISKEELTIKEALCICLIIGVQWNVKFKGVS